MKRLAIKVIGYLILSYLLFYVTISLADSEVKTIRLHDLQNKKDWFMFSWLFLLPLVLELIILTYPFTYGLRKVTESQNRLIYYVLFLMLFIIEFVLYHYVFSINYPIVKAGISCLLFIILFRKRLFDNG